MTEIENRIKPILQPFISDHRVLLNFVENPNSEKGLFSTNFTQISKRNAEKLKVPNSP